MEAEQIAHGLIQGYIGSDHRVIDMANFYRALVQALFDAGVSRNVYCVNVDAVIAALLLKMLWQPLRRGDISEARMRGHLSADGAEQTGSQSYVPADEKDDKALGAAYNFLRGVTVNADVRAARKAAVPN